MELFVPNKPTSLVGFGKEEKHVQADDAISIATTRGKVRNRTGMQTISVLLQPSSLRPLGLSL